MYLLFLSYCKKKKKDNAKNRIRIRMYKRRQSHLMEVLTNYKYLHRNKIACTFQNNSSKN